MSTASPPIRSQTVVEWSSLWDRWIVSALHRGEWTLVGIFDRGADAFEAAGTAATRLVEDGRGAQDTLTGAGSPG